MKRSVLCAGTLLAIAAASAPPLGAQGSSIYQQSACSSSRAGAGVADPCADGSAIFFNPAALAMRPGIIGIGVSGIYSGAEFTYDFTGETIERDANVAPVPFAYASYRLNDRMALGLGVWAPYGLGIDWPLDFEGRFVGYDNALRGVYIQPTVAYALAPWISVGGGVDVVLGSIEINRRLDLADQFVPNPATGQLVLNPVTGAPITFANLGVPLGTDFADATLEGSGTAVTFHIGLLADLTENLSFGFRYLHFADIDFDEGTAAFEQVPTGLILPPNNPLEFPGGTELDVLLGNLFGGPLATQAISTNLKLPNQAVFGFRYRPIPGIKLLADYQFHGWSSFNVAVIDFENAPDQPLILDYQDTHTFRLGTELALGTALIGRAGFRYNTAAEKDASVSPLLPEAERQYYTLGLGYRVTDRLTADFAYQFVNQADRRGRVRGRSSFAQTAEDLNVGVYSADAQVFGITLSYQFGN